MISPYRPAKCSQIDGSSYQQQNCVAAGTVMLMDRGTVGRVRTTPAEVRRRSGATVDASGRKRGLFLSEAEAVAKSFGVVLEQRGFDNPATRRGQLMNLVASGRGVGVCIDTHVTAGTDYATNWFRGRHFVVINQYAWRMQEKPHAVFITEDPGTTQAGWLEWPADLLYRAAEAYANGVIFTLATLDTEGVSRRVRLRAALKSAPSPRAATRGHTSVGEHRTVARTVNGAPRANGDYGWHELASGLYVKGPALA